jgi:hypothetical protein
MGVLGLNGGKKPLAGAESTAGRQAAPCMRSVPLSN